MSLGINLRINIRIKKIIIYFFLLEGFDDDKRSSFFFLAAMLKVLHLQLPEQLRLRQERVKHNSRSVAGVAYPCHYRAATTYKYGQGYSQLYNNFRVLVI